MKQKAFLFLYILALTNIPLYAQVERARADTNIIDRIPIKFHILSPNINQGIFPVSKRMSFYLESEQNQYRDLGGYYLTYMALLYRVNNNLQLDGGILSMKQFSNNLSEGGSGLRFNVNYYITDQLYLNLWGQYLTGNSTYNFLMPQTETGASMKLDLGKSSKIGIGSQYQYDKLNDKWNYQSGGKLQVNF